MKDLNIFLKTFLPALLIVMVIATPVFTKVGEVLELTPGDQDGPVLEDEINFTELIPTDSPFFDAFTNTNRVNILALGTDRNNLTDTIILVSFDVDNKLLDLISIPRDTYYYRGPGYIDKAHHKINAAYRGNPVNTAKAVSEILMNIPINKYVLVSYDSVAVIVDEIGGVPMDIPFHMKYDDPRDTPPLHVDIKPGEQVLDGKTSVGFLRFRKGNSGYRGYPDADLGRIKAQQEFLKSAAKESMGLNLFNIAKVAYKNVQSDMTLRETLYLATKVVGMDAESIRAYQIPVGGEDTRPDMQGIAEMLTEIYSIKD